MNVISSSAITGGRSNRDIPASLARAPARYGTDGDALAGGSG